MLMLCFPLAYAVVYLVFFLVLYVPRPNYEYYFDAKDFNKNKPDATFEPHCKRYQSFARLLITLSTASIAFLLNFLVKTGADANGYSIRLALAAPAAVVFFGFSALSAMAFILSESYFYEDYCHGYKYKAWKYALNLGFALATLFWFAFTFAYLAWRLFK